MASHGGGNIHEIPSSKNPNYRPPPPAPAPWENPNLSAWQNGIVWSEYNIGPCEPEVQREWTRLDQVYPRTHLMYYCVNTTDHVPLGRLTAMEIARYAAFSGQDQKAFDITVSTQFHNPTAVAILRQAGVAAVAGFLRDHTSWLEGVLIHLHGGGHFDFK